MPRGGESLAKRAEHHREDDAERIVKSRKRVGAEVRMLIERRRHPWMRQLQKRRSARPQKKRRFAIDLPACGRWAKNAFSRIGYFPANGFPENLRVLRQNRCRRAIHISIMSAERLAVASRRIVKVSLYNRRTTSHAGEA